MRLAIIGSRNCLRINIEALLKYIPDTIVSGGAKGADTYAREFACKHQIKLLERNKQIVDNCDCLLALWDGVSRGTKYTIDLAISKGKLVKIYNYITK